MMMQGSIFWDISPRSPVKFDTRLEGSFYLHLHGRRISQARNQQKKAASWAKCVRHQSLESCVVLLSRFCKHAMAVVFRCLVLNVVFEVTATFMGDFCRVLTKCLNLATKHSRAILLFETFWGWYLVLRKSSQNGRFLRRPGYTLRFKSTKYLTNINESTPLL
jgi:hypothetical protein